MSRKPVDKHAQVRELEGRAKEATREAAGLRNEIAHAAAKGHVAGHYRQVMLREHERSYVWEWVGKASYEHRTVYILRRVANDPDDAWMRVVDTETLLQDYVRALARKPARARRRKS